MDLIVANIPQNTRIVELKEFFKDFLKDATFELVRLKGKYDAVLFAHIHIPKDRIGIKAIRKLNLKLLLGRRVQVREFQVRSASHDRRTVGWRNKPWSNAERRVAERRVVRVNSHSEDPVIEAYMNMARKSP